MDKNLPGRAEQGGTQIPSHAPKVERGSMGLLLSHFQGAQSYAKDTPGRVVLQESIAYFGSAHYRMVEAPR